MISPWITPPSMKSPWETSVNVFLLNDFWFAVLNDCSLANDCCWLNRLLLWREVSKELCWLLKLFWDENDCWLDATKSCCLTKLLLSGADGIFLPWICWKPLNWLVWGCWENEELIPEDKATEAGSFVL